MNLREARALLADRGFRPGATSTRTFPDGSPYKVEIPSCEGPRVMTAVLEEAKTRGITIDRVSQGSGVMLLTDHELDEMAALGKARGIEVSLFIGPRAGWDTGAMSYASAGKAVAPKTRGMDQLIHTIEEVKRAREHGIGLLKKDYLSYTRMPAELELLRALKLTLDPNHILNPGKILDV